MLTRKSIVILRNENRAIWRNWKSKFTRFLKPAEFDCLANTRTRWLILNKRISETLSGIKRLLVRRLLAPCKEIIRSLYYWSFEWNHYFADFAVSFDASICLTVKRIQIHRATSQKEKVWKYIRRWLCEVLRQIKTQQQQINCFRGWEKGRGRKESWKEKKTGYLKQCQWFDFNFDLNFEFTIVLSCSDN